MKKVKIKISENLFNLYLKDIYFMFTHQNTNISGVLFELNIYFYDRKHNVFSLPLTEYISIKAEDLIFFLMIIFLLKYFFHLYIFIRYLYHLL